MREPPLTDDLAVLARRDALTPSERRRLEMLLSAAPVDRYLYDLGRDYDAVPSATAGDDALVARLAERVAVPGIEARFPRPRWLVGVAAAAGLFVSLGAAAIALPRWLAPPRAAPVAQCARCAEEVASATGRRSPSRMTPVAGASAADLASAHSPDQAPPAGSAAASAPTVSAKTEFARANALRKSGQTAAAVAAYRKLQAAYPRSPEAVLSHVLLGRILLRAGSAEAAEAEFARYRAASPGGSLTEEALHGEAAALRMCGRTAEERGVHQELVARFPSSIYARASRARLRELE